MTLSDLQGMVMDRRDILALYQWATGTCFRCAKDGVDTTYLGELDPPAGGHYEIRVCAECVLELEEERQRHAKRKGYEYEPGKLGCCKP